MKSYVGFKNICFLVAITLAAAVVPGLFLIKSTNSHLNGQLSSIVLMSQSLLVQSAYAETKTDPKTAAEAIALARNSRQYLFILFYDKEDDMLKAIENTIKTFRSKSSSKVLTYRASTVGDKESDVVLKYGVNRSPLPLLLVFAPNGAITGGFNQKVTTEQLTQSCSVPELVMNILRPLQEGKIALVSLQNNKTKFNQESDKAVYDFSSDEKLKPFVEVIKADPDDKKNADFLTQCKLDKTISESTVVFLIPPGSVVGVYPGKITKDTLMAALSSCQTGSGCCPKK
jgi:hypothetical protein